MTSVTSVVSVGAAARCVGRSTQSRFRQSILASGGLIFGIWALLFSSFCLPPAAAPEIREFTQETHLTTKTCRTWQVINRVKASAHHLFVWFLTLLRALTDMHACFYTQLFFTFIWMHEHNGHKFDSTISFFWKSWYQYKFLTSS